MTDTKPTLPAETGGAEVTEQAALALRPAQAAAEGATASASNGSAAKMR